MAEDVPTDTVDAGLLEGVCMILLLAARLLLWRLDRTQTVEPGFNEKTVAQAFFNLRIAGHDKHRAI